MKTFFRRHLKKALIAGACLVLPGAVSALPVTLNSVANINQCDILTVPRLVDELGPPLGFPIDELIAFDPVNTGFTPNCGAAQVANATHYEIVMINNSGRSFSDVWFVADSPNFWVGEYDGSVNNGPAMRIDSSGVNQPLISESMTANEIFEPGETWIFRINNWVAPQQPVLGSPARVGDVSIGDISSNASIIANPEPVITNISAQQCFYECKRSPDGGFFTEVTTLMIANGKPPTTAGVHINTHRATAVILNGNEKPVAVTQTLLSTRDLDELNVCATLQQTAGIVAPSAGSIQMVIEGLPNVSVPGDTQAVQVWMKNVIGKMKVTDPEVFNGRITGVGKTMCRDIDKTITTGADLLKDPEVQAAPKVPPILIEETSD